MDDKLAVAFLVVMVPLGVAVYFSMPTPEDMVPHKVEDASADMKSTVAAGRANLLNDERLDPLAAEPGYRKSFEQTAPVTQSQPQVQPQPQIAAAPAPQSSPPAASELASAVPQPPTAISQSRAVPSSTPSFTSPASPAAINGARSNPGAANAASPPAGPLATVPPLTMMLRDSRLLTVTDEFDDVEKAIDKTKKKTYESDVIVIPYNNKHELMRIARKGKALNGDSVAFYPHGAPMAFAGYADGKRNGEVCAWDNAGRPLWLLQFKKDKKNGLCCVFKACGPNCKHGHLWLAQEWNDGELRRTHYVSDQEIAHTFEYPGLDYQPIEPGHPEFADATKQLDALTEQFEKNETFIKQWVSSYFKHSQAMAKVRRQAGSAYGGGSAMQDQYLSFAQSLASPHAIFVSRRGYVCVE